MSRNEVLIAIVAAVLVVFSLTVAMLVPKRNPDFPRRGIGFFVAVCVVLVAGMLATVEVVGGEEEGAEAVAPAEPGPAEPEPPGPAPAEPAPPETGGPAGDPEAGAKVFASAGCAGCHALADAGASGTVGPNLDASKPDLAKAIDRVTNGRGVMPSFKGQLSEREIQDVAAYVVQATQG